MAYTASQPGSLFGGGSSEADAVQGHAVTPDIDTEFFLNAAKDIFNRMQAAWDKKDMDEIRGFCLPEVANRIEMEMGNLGDKTTETEVATLAAEITDAWVESNLEWVAVHFTAMIQEKETGSETTADEGRSTGFSSTILQVRTQPGIWPESSRADLHSPQV